MTPNSEVSFRDGIIFARTLPVDTADDVVRRLSAVEWRPSKIGYKHDVFRIKEQVDKTHRDTLSADIETAGKIAEELISVTGPTVFNLISQYWDLSLWITSGPQFTRYCDGHFISPHRDSGGAYPDRIFSVVTYLTDQYAGGDISFPRIGKSFHPRAGETLIFPSDFVHGVNPIESGKKEVFLYFVDREVLSSNRGKT